jgi:signal transduction histidine kinase
LSEWLKNARGTADQLAQGASPAALTGWETLRVDRAGNFTGTSGHYLNLSGPAQTGGNPCGTAAGLRELVDAAGRTAEPVALVINPPGSCDPMIGVARTVSTGTFVITGELAPLLARAAFASSLEQERDIRTIVVDPGGTVVSPVLPSTAAAAPPYLSRFAARVSSSNAATSGRSTTNGDRPTKVVDAGAPIDSGWSVIVEQDASSFDVKPAFALSRTVVVVVIGLFAILLLLQALADAKRRMQLRYADAHTAAFLAVLGHELRTPLTVIRGFVDTLTSRWASLDDTQRHDLVDRLPQQSRRLNRVVERLLLAANLQAGAATRPSLSAIPVAQTLERVADEFRPMAPLHQFIVVAPNDVAARAEAKTLEQILDQLVDNAVRYSPSGGLVRIASARRRGHVEIAVEDEGIGLPADTRSIFKAFAQGESVDRRVHDEGGVGVGLYIARRLCEQLGGSVRAERRSQGGARFVVTLRAARVREQATV